MKYRIGIAALIAMLAFLGGAYPSAASSNQPAAHDADIRRADQLLRMAIETLPADGWKRLQAQAEIVSYHIEAGHCPDALAAFAELEAFQTPDTNNVTRNPYAARLTRSAHRSGLQDCAVAFSRFWARDARNDKQMDELAQVGAILRVLGNDAEGLTLINEAETGVHEVLKRTSYLWLIRMQALRVYEGTDIFAPELERSARELLAALRSAEERIEQPIAGNLAAMLFENGNADLGRQIAAAECAIGPARTVPCGNGGYLDRNLARLSEEMATGTPAEQKNAMEMLARAGAIDRLVPHFQRMVEIEGGNKAAAFSKLAYYSHRLWPTDAVAAVAGARQAFALGLARPDEGHGLNASSWHLLNRYLAEIFAGAGDDNLVKEVIQRSKPRGEERDSYYAAIASGYARSGNEAAMQHYVNAIANKQQQRRAWWAIAFGTPGVSVEQRLQAGEHARSIPYVADPKTVFISPPPGVVVCGEFPGGVMIAAEGASAETLITLAQFSKEEGNSGLCAYRRFLLGAAGGTGHDARARAIALELLQTTQRPCTAMSCDDLKVLQLLVDLRLYDEAERLALMFEEDDRTVPLIRIAIGLIGPAPRPSFPTEQ